MAVLDRQKLETILARRFPGATTVQIAVSANAIMGLEEEWDEVWYTDLQAFAAELSEGAEIRVSRRRTLSEPPGIRRLHVSIGRG